MVAEAGSIDRGVKHIGAAIRRAPDLASDSNGAAVCSSQRLARHITALEPVGKNIKDVAARIHASTAGKSALFALTSRRSTRLGRPPVENVADKGDGFSMSAN
jgi:hypothetical protein